MEIVKKYFSEVIPDNEEVYFAHLIGVIESVDELCTLQISKFVDMYQFRIAPSIPAYNTMLLNEILSFHNRLGIRLNISKSIKTSGTLVFEILL